MENSQNTDSYYKQSPNLGRKGPWLLCYVFRFLASGASTEEGHPGNHQILWLITPPGPVSSRSKTVGFVVGTKPPEGHPNLLQFW